jgi:hypothetical protein
MRPEARAGQSFCEKQDGKSSGFICLISNELYGYGGGSCVDKTGVARLGFWLGLRYWPQCED